MTQEFVTLPREVVEQALDALFMYKPMVTGVTFQHGLEAMQALRAALEQPQGGEKQPDWPKLDKPARVGGGSFGVGTSSQHVVMAAQRAYEENVRAGTLTHEQMVEEERNRRALWDLIHGSAALKQPQVEQEPVAWMYEQQAVRNERGVGGWDHLLLFCKPAPEKFKRNITPLYAHPHHKREPLTVEKIRAIQHELSDTVGCSYETMARAIEAAHNIK